MTARRACAAALAAIAFAALTWRAAEETGPIAASFRVAGNYWRGSTQSRLLNSLVFRQIGPTGSDDTALGMVLIGRDRAWPLDVDAVLVLPPDVPRIAAEAKRRKAAFVLAPRRVTLARGETGPAGFSLAQAARGAP